MVPVTNRTSESSPSRAAQAAPRLPHRLHLLGAGGAGLSGAARLLAHAGHRVTGHDREASPFTAALGELGVQVQLGASATDQLPEDAELVARSAAVSDDDPQVRAARARGLEVIKYSELLGRLCPVDRTLAVAGTHGKTTTTWMLHEALEAAGGPAPGTLVGGLHQTRGLNAIAPDPAGWFAVEACEYDRSFLQLSPFGAAVTNFEEDHLDCYGSLEELERSFCRFVERVSSDGLVVLGSDVPASLREAARGRVWTMGQEVQLDLLGQQRGYFRFQVRGPGWSTPEVQLAVPGRFNVDDAAIAIALAVGCAGVSPAAAARGVAEFPGAARRFERWGEPGGVPVVHDYAHHPTELRVTIEAARRAFPGRRLEVLFQPHQASRTARHMDGFVEALRGCDRVVVTDVYGARRHIDRIEGADAATLASKLRRAGVDAVAGGAPAEAGVRFVDGLAAGACALVMGAGDIDTLKLDLLDAVALRFPPGR